MPDPNIDQPQPEAALARRLIARLERLSADSYWAHRASGVRGALLRCLEQVERGPATGASNAAVQALERLVEQGFTILANAAREIEEPK